MARKPKPTSAWLVTWEGADPDHPDYGSVVAVLNFRYTARKVAVTIEQLYMVLSSYTGGEKLAYARDPRNNPCPAEADRFSRITCGHNPWLYGRMVSNLREEAGELKWDEPLSPREIMTKFPHLG
jgi:hypothetical protein